jgi:hypothetical protein
MVNFGLNSASLLGIILAVAGAGLYFLRSVRPELSRDQDIAFTAIGIICGFILIFQGWRLDPILQFGQFLLTGSAIFFAYESIKLRGIATEQAKEKTRIVDDERPVSRRYKAEIEDRDYLEERPRNSRRLRGENARRSDDWDEEEATPRRRRNPRQLPDNRLNAAAPERRRSYPERTTRDRGGREYPDEDRASAALTRRPAAAWEDESDWSDEATPKRSRRALPDADTIAPETNQRDRAPNYEPEDSDTPRRRRRPPYRPTESAEGSMANYVDYEPIDPHPDALDPGTEPINFPDRY